MFYSKFNVSSAIWQCKLRDRFIYFFLRMSKSVMKRLLSAYNLEKCPAIAWGITNEKTAVANYTSLGAFVDETGTCTLKLWGD